MLKIDFRWFTLGSKLATGSGLPAPAPAGTRIQPAPARLLELRSLRTSSPAGPILVPGAQRWKDRSDGMASAAVPSSPAASDVDELDGHLKVLHPVRSTFEHEDLEPIDQETLR